MKEDLRSGLRSLPQPKNDYEIVVPEEERDSLENDQPSLDNIMDQADIDAEAIAAAAAKSMRFITYPVYFVSDFLIIYQNIT